MAVSTEILVVDDEVDLREMVAEYLARHGFHVRTAIDGDGMAARLQEKSADLVILDINMPGEDGLTLARRLREHSDVCKAAFAQIEFATDSPLEGTGFELLVRGRGEAGLSRPFDAPALVAVRG